LFIVVSFEVSAMFSVSAYRPSSSVRAVAVALEHVRCVGFSGSRCGFTGQGEQAFIAAAAVMQSDCRVLVGDARGVDAEVRRWFSAADVFRVCGSGRGAVAARSIRLVIQVQQFGGSLLVFPGAECPSGLRPSAQPRECFCGLGSGSWASAALAVGLGLPVLLWVPESGWLLRSWQLEPLGGDWFGSLPF
jgi:hypothetical protein